MSTVDPERLRRHLTTLAVTRHPWQNRQQLEAAQAYVTREWESCGYAVSTHGFSYMSERFVNLIARPADFPAGPRLIIGAHLDAVVGTPGADDNASGVAAMLEISRALAGRAWRVPVEFVAFNLEETGMIGSGAYAAELRANRTPVLGMLSLEMLGFTKSEGTQQYPWFLRGKFPAVGNFIGVAANSGSRRLMDTLAAAMRTVEGLPVVTLVVPADGRLFRESRLSDHSPFWDAGYPALLVTDTSFFRNPHYHRASDTVETLNLGFLERVARGLIAAVEALDARERAREAT